MLITLDGYCSQGKSTIGKELAKALDLEFFSIGILFRFLAAKTLEGSSCSEKNLKAAVCDMHQMSISDIQSYPFVKSRQAENMLQCIAAFEFVYDEVANKIQGYALRRDILLDGRFGFKIFPNADRNYYCLSSKARRVSFASKARGMTLEEAEKYIDFRDSFEIKYELPDYVKTVQMDGFENVEQAVSYFINDVNK